MTETAAVQEAVQDATATTEKRGGASWTDEQKQAITMRREATMLRKYGHEDEAKKLEAQANVLAPAGKQSQRDDPMKLLSAEDQTKLKEYFRKSAGFARLCQVVSYKKLSEIVEELSE